MSIEDAQMMAQIENLPNSLRYGARQLQVRVARTTNLLPINNTTVQGDGSGTTRFRFPSASIINLSSATVSFNSTISNLVTGTTNFINANFPASYKYIRRVQFYLGGISVAGSLCNQYNLVYHAMVRAVGNKEFAHTKVLEGFQELVDGYDASGVLLNDPPAATSKSTYQQIDDFLLLAKGNGGTNEMMIDTSIWNDLELQIDFDDNKILSVYRDGTATNDTAKLVSWALSNIRLNVDVISSIPPIYASFLSIRSQRPEPIRLVFQNLVSQIQQVNGSNRLQVSSMCIDGLMVCPLSATYNQFASFAGNVATTPANPYNVTNPPYFNFNSGLDNTTAGQFSGVIQVGSTQYPTTAYNNAYLLADSTLNHYWSNSMSATSLLFLSLLAKDNGTAGDQTLTEGTYVPSTFLSNNCVWVQSFSLEDGWSSPQKVLSGIDTSSQNCEIIVIQTGISSSLNFLLVGLLSSVLEFDTIAKRIRVIQ
tara:strand:- start:13461 stop:14900 length:1440 start_codon:yes stop_codon:yes gene_type:complete